MSIKNKALIIITGMFLIILPIALMYKTIYVSLVMALLFGGIFLYKYKFLLIVILITINEQLFYLIEADSLPINAIEVAIVVYLFIICMVIIKVENRQENLYFKTCIILFSITPFVSTIAANILNNQGLALGISASKRYFVYLIYIYLITSIKNKKDVYKIENIMIYLGTLLSICFLIQSVASLDLFKIVVMDSRTGGMRFFQGYAFIMFSYLISLAKIFDKKTTKTKTIICLSCCFIELLSIVIVSQTRNFIISILVSTFLVVLFQDKYRKVFLISGLILIVFVFILFGIDLNIGLTELLQSSIYDIKNGVGTIGVRIREIQFYLSYFFQHPFFGMGDYNDKFYRYSYISGLYLRYYTVDVGIIGYIFNLGIFGITIFITLIVKVIKIIIQLRNDRNVAYNLSIGFLGFVLSGLLSTFYIQNSDSILYVCIILVIIELYYKNSLKEMEEHNETNTNSNNNMLQ